MTPEHAAQLRLWRTKNVGSITFWQLLKQFGSAAAALENIGTLSQRGGRKKPLISPKLNEIKIEEEKLHYLGGQFVFSDQPEYPTLLKEIYDFPPVLSALGHVHLLNKPTIGIVGARNASSIGLRMTRELTQGLAKAGYIIASGMARGIDGVAHEAAINTGTVAVLAGGVDIIFPREHKVLHANLRQQGCIISEMPLGMQPQARHFPRRNRIISGLSCGVLVVEAALHSGSLISAQFAMEQGREVFAVPGSPLDPRARGGNKLLKDGANFVENVDDILDVLAQISGLVGLSMANDKNPSMSSSVEDFDFNIDDQDINDARNRIFNFLSTAPTHIDQLICDAKLPPNITQAALIELELAGRVERLPGNRIIRLEFDQMDEEDAQPRFI